MLLLLLLVCVLPTARSLPESGFEFLDEMLQDSVEETQVNQIHVLTWRRTPMDGLAAAIRSKRGLKSFCAEVECTQGEGKRLQKVVDQDLSASLSLIRWASTQYYSGITVAIKVARALVQKHGAKTSVFELILPQEAMNFKELLIDYLSPSTGPLTRPALFKFLNATTAAHSPPTRFLDAQI